MTHPKDIKISSPDQFALLNDLDFLNQIVSRFLQQFLEHEIASFLQAEPYERTDQRTGYRSGYKSCVLKTRVGRIELSVPQDREIKRRADVVQIFPNTRACERLVGALCLEWSEEWLTGRRYLDMAQLQPETAPCPGATLLHNFWT